MSERLCPDCQKIGRCSFREYTDWVTQELNLRHITDQNLLMDAALEVHEKINKARVEARAQECPNLNDIDPDYPGKNLL